MIINNRLLDQISGQTEESERLRINFSLYETLDAKAQRLLNALEVGAVLPIHRHRRTAKTYILLRGRINVMFYNADGGKMERYKLYPGNGVYRVHIPKGQWHTLEVPEPSAVFKVKNGPYIPLDKEDILEQLFVRSFWNTSFFVSLRIK